MQYHLTSLSSQQEATLPLPPRPIPNPTLTTTAPSPLPPNFLSSDPHLWRIYDPESIRIMADVNGEGNPVEAKYRRLARSHRTGRGDRELKPGPDMRDLLNVSFMLLRVQRSGLMLSLSFPRIGPFPPASDLYPFSRRQRSHLALSILA